LPYPEEDITIVNMPDDEDDVENETEDGVFVFAGYIKPGKH